jgi:hypothetical protein
MPKYILLFVFIIVAKITFAQTIRKCFIENYDSNGKNIFGPTLLDNITTFDTTNNIISVINYVPCKNAIAIKDSLVKYDTINKTWKLQTYNCMQCNDSFVDSKSYYNYTNNILQSKYVLNKNGDQFDTTKYIYTYKKNKLWSRAKFKNNKNIATEKYDAVGTVITNRYLYKLDKRGRVIIATQKEKSTQQEKITMAYNAKNKISKMTVFTGKIKSQETYYNYDDSLNIVSEETILLDKEGNIFTSNIFKYEDVACIKNKALRIVDETYYVNDIKRSRTYYYYNK